MNLLARKIGIWFKTVVWRDMMFNEILEHMPEEAVERAYCGVNGATIKLVDNSVIELFRLIQLLAELMFSSLICKKE